MKDTGPPINDNFCPNEACTPKYVEQFNRDVLKMIEHSKERRIKAVQEIVGSRADAIRVLKCLEEIVP